MHLNMNLLLRGNWGSNLCIFFYVKAFYSTVFLYPFTSNRERVGFCWSNSFNSRTSTVCRHLHSSNTVWYRLITHCMDIFVLSCVFCFYFFIFSCSSVFVYMLVFCALFSVYLHVLASWKDRLRYCVNNFLAESC